MKDKLFKKYEHSFFWVKKENHLEIQKILKAFGFKIHSGEGFIEWHDGFNNLCTFKPDKFHNYHYFQKVCFYMPNTGYGSAVTFEELKLDYEKFISNSESEEK